MDRERQGEACRIAGLQEEFVIVRVNRRLLAWIVFVSLACLGAGIAVHAVWPDMFPAGGGLGAVSFGFPSLVGLPFVIGNIALSVIARRRGGRPRSIGSFCLWTLGSLIALSLAVGLMPPTVFQAMRVELFVVVLLLVGMGMSLPVQLLILAFLMFAVIGRSRAGTADQTL
jgi:hypothetical protein